MLRDKIKKGDVINIYTDFQDECPLTYEGKAKLLSKIRDGDSFYLKDEEIKVSEKKSYSADEQAKMAKYNKLKVFFHGKDDVKAKKYAKGLYLALCKQRKDLPDDFDRMNDLIEQYKKKDHYKTHVIELLKLFDKEYIFRFVQQDRDKWRPTIWKYERWLVEFIEDSKGWKCSFRTQRNIRLVSCIMPSENTRDADIRKYTTYNGVSSIKSSQIEDSDDDFDDEEILLSDDDLRDFIIE